MAQQAETRHGPADEDVHGLSVDLVDTPDTSTPADDTGPTDAGPTGTSPTGTSEIHPSRRRLTIAGVVVFCWLRIGLILGSNPFETADTESYRSGQGTRPPLGAALLSRLGDSPYVLLSAVVSTAGVVTLAWALWDPRRRRWSTAVVTAIGVVSLLPMVAVYEHWLLPDSLLLGLSLLALALAWRVGRGTGRAWFDTSVWTRPAAWAVVGLCLAATTTKEIGVAVALIVAGVLLARRRAGMALAIALSSLLVFVAVVMPCADRPGIVLWRTPADTPVTMARFRVIVVGLLWSDLSPQMAEVRQRAAECGMTVPQFIAETAGSADAVVHFYDCPELWAVVDDISQVDVLAAHVAQPAHVVPSITNAMAGDMWAMAVASGFPVQQSWALRLDRWVAATVGLLPVLALAVSLLRRRGRGLALVAVTASLAAIVVALLDPTGQVRHTMVLRVVAAAVALFALTEATDRPSRPGGWRPRRHRELAPPSG